LHIVINDWLDDFTMPRASTSSAILYFRRRVSFYLSVA
jgi:hypothetical protein